MTTESVRCMASAPTAALFIFQFFLSKGRVQGQVVVRGKSSPRQNSRIIKEFLIAMLQPIPEDRPKVDPDPSSFSLLDIKESSGFKALQTWQQAKIISDLEIIKKQTELSLLESLKLYQQWGYDVSEAIVHHLDPNTKQLDKSIRSITLASNLTESEKKIKELREIVDAKNLLFDAIKKQGRPVG